MELNFDFRNLFILDLANNHQGSVEHGLEVIRQHAEVVRKHGVRAAIKFQFRDIDTFIHPDHTRDSSNKHIPRFLSTRLNRDDYQRLFDEVKKQGLYTMCTPFDEPSVELIAEMGFDLIKIASCSARTGPLSRWLRKPTCRRCSRLADWKSTTWTISWSSASTVRSALR